MEGELACGHKKSFQENVRTTTKVDDNLLLLPIASHNPCNSCMLIRPSSKKATKVNKI